MSDKPAPVVLPDALEIVPLRQQPRAIVSVPGSKSLTNRALVLAALSTRAQPCQLLGALHSEDTAVMVAGLQALGFNVRPDWHAQPPTITVEPVSSDRVIPAPQADLFV